MSDKVQSIIEEIKGLSLLEASQLVKGLEEAFGVSAAAASVAVAACRQAVAQRQLLPRRRRNSTSSLPQSAATRSASSRLFAKSPVWD